MIYLINYANEPYAKMQKFQSYTAKHFGGVDKIIEFSDKDIIEDKEFYKENEKILKIKKGNGLWLWKPYIIHKTLSSLSENDILIYSDVDTIFLDNIEPLISAMLKEDKYLMVFDSPNKEYQYTKYNLCIDMDLTSEFILNTRQRYASYNIWRKSDLTLNFLSQWLNYCSQYKLISDDVTAYNDKYGNEFVRHLHDQSIFSLLTKKHAIQSLRDPSNWGNKLKKEYPNSNYEQILYNGVANSRKLWILTRLLGKSHLNKFKK